MSRADLEKAIKSENLQQLELLFQNNPMMSKELEHEGPLFNRLPLCLAVECSTVQIVEYLIQKGADINGMEVHSESDSAAYVAVSLRRTDMIDVLHLHSADFNLWNDREPGSSSSFDLLVHDFDEKTILYLFQKGIFPERGDELSQAAAVSPKTLQFLLQKGMTATDLKYLFDKKYEGSVTTPLHHLARNKTKNALDVANTLIDDLRFDVNENDGLEGTCCHIAVEEDNYQMLCRFLEQDVDFEEPDMFDEANLLNFAIGHAVRGGNEKMVTLILAAGADVHHIRGYRQTPTFLLENNEIQNQMWQELFLAAGGRFPKTQNCTHPLEFLFSFKSELFTPVELEKANRRIEGARNTLVYRRAWHICVGLQNLRISVLEMCEILVNACGRIAPLIPFHIWWKIATKVKHFHQRK